MLSLSLEFRNLFEFRPVLANGILVQFSSVRSVFSCCLKQSVLIIHSGAFDTIFMSQNHLR